MISYGAQSIDESDVDAVVAALQSDFLTQGPVVSEFESDLVQNTGASYVVACSSATAALHALCLSLDFSVDTTVWVSGISFVASANCARYCGANVDFVDIDSSTFNICPVALEEKLEATSVANHPDYLIVVHMAGEVCELKALSDLAYRYNFSIIEDASHALGASYLGDNVGNCRYSIATVFSFHPVKMITTAEGGAITTNSESLAHKVRQAISHGITRYDAEFEADCPDPWHYEQKFLGFNYRLSEIHAALGRSQLAKLPSFLARRQKLASIYANELNLRPDFFHIQTVRSSVDCSYHLFIATVNFGLAGKTRVDLYQFLKSSGIMLNLHYRPIYRQPYYYNTGLYTPLSGCERYAASAFTLPLHANLLEKQVLYVVSRLKTFFEFL